MIASKIEMFSGLDMAQLAKMDLRERAFTLVNSMSYEEMANLLEDLEETISSVSHEQFRAQLI